MPSDRPEIDMALSVLPNRLTFPVIRGQVAGCERTVAVPEHKLLRLKHMIESGVVTFQELRTWLDSVWPVETRMKGK